MGSLQKNLLILRADGLPDLFAHDQYIGDHGVLIDRVDLADLAVLAGGQGRFVVLGAVDDAGLQRGVDIAVGHGDRDAAEVAHHIGLALHILHADLQALQVCRGADGLILRVEGTCAGGVVGQRDKAVVAGREEEVLHLLGVHDVVEVGGVIEDIGQAEGIERFVVGGQAGGRDFRHGDNTRLQLLEVFVLAAKLAVGEDLDLDAAIGLFGDFVGKLGHGDMDSVGLRQAVGQRQHQRVLGAVAGIGRGTGRAAAGHKPDAQRRRSTQGCNSLEHNFLLLIYVVAAGRCSGESPSPLRGQPPLTRGPLKPPLSKRGRRDSSPPPPPYIPIKSNCSNETSTSWSFLGLGYLICTLLRRWL